MPETLADNPDLAVEELRRKARRRLVGAVVLALAAATLLPLLLEQEQKPLGDDVSVQIPPIDGGRFVSRLNGDTGKTDGSKGAPTAGATSPGGAAPAAGTPHATASVPVAPRQASGPAPEPPPLLAAPAVTSGAVAGSVVETPTGTAAPDVAAAPAAPAATTAGAVVSPKAPAPVKPPAPAPAKPAAPALASATTLTETMPAAKAEAAAVAAPKGDGSPAAAAKTESTTAAGEPRPESGPPGGNGAKGEGFVVQLGAFTDTYGAGALAARLKKAGYAAYTEPVESGKATLWRVRVGGYPTRQAANEARTKLKAEGHDGRVVAAR